MTSIAEKKIRQIGGETIGVVVRRADGILVAVTDMGRVTRLDDSVAGPVAPSCQENLDNSDHIADANKMVRDESESCRFHDHDTEACETYSGQVPCEPELPTDHRQRAKDTVENWPKWKRDFRITKDSPEPPATQEGSGND